MSDWKPDTSLLNARVGAVMASGAWSGARTTEWDSRWSATEQHPDAALAGDLETLRARSQDLHRNSAIIDGATRALAVGAVGRGIRPRSTAVTGRGDAVDAQVRAIIDAEWEQWEPTCMADGQRGLYDAQAALVYAMARDGDCLCLFPDVGGRLTVDLVSASRISTPSDRYMDGKIRHGVEWSGRRVAAYWVSDIEGGRGKADDFWRFTPDRGGRINCRMASRPMAGLLGASRVPPVISPALGTIKDLETSLQAERRRVVAASKITGVLTSPDPEKIDRAWTNLQSGNDLAKEYRSRSFGTLFDAQIMSLASGESMQLFSPNNTNPNLGAYVETMLKMIAGCYGLPWNVAFGILDRLNYSNARTNKTSARRTFELWQREVIRSLCKPAWTLFVQYLYAEGKLPVRDLPASIYAADWRADTERWVDPAKEISAASEAIAVGISSHHSVCADIGEDEMEILRQEIAYVAARKAMLEAAGLDEADMGYVPRESISKTESETESVTRTEGPDDE